MSVCRIPTNKLCIVGFLWVLDLSVTCICASAAAGKDEMGDHHKLKLIEGKALIILAFAACLQIT